MDVLEGGEKLENNVTLLFKVELNLAELCLEFLALYRLVIQ